MSINFHHHLSQSYRVKSIIDHPSDIALLYLILEAHGYATDMINEFVTDRNFSIDIAAVIVKDSDIGNDGTMINGRGIRSLLIAKCTVNTSDDVIARKR